MAEQQFLQIPYIKDIFKYLPKYKHDYLVQEFKEKHNITITKEMYGVYNCGDFLKLFKKGYNVSKLILEDDTIYYYEDIITFRKHVQQLKLVNICYNDIVQLLPHNLKSLQIIKYDHIWDIDVIRFIPDTVERLYLDKSVLNIELDREFIKDYYNSHTYFKDALQHSKTYDISQLPDNVVIYIENIDYNILSPSGNLWEFWIPDLWAHKNALINFPDYCQIKTFSFMYNWIEEYKNQCDELEALEDYRNEVLPYRDY